MKKLIANPLKTILTALISSAIISAVGFTYKVNATLDVHEEKIKTLKEDLVEYRKDMSMIWSKLEQIDSKLGKR